jgi:hypothetical protein
LVWTHLGTVSIHCWTTRQIKGSVSSRDMYWINDNILSSIHLPLSTYYHIDHTFWFGDTFCQDRLQVQVLWRGNVDCNQIVSILSTFLPICGYGIYQSNPFTTSFSLEFIPLICLLAIHPINLLLYVKFSLMPKKLDFYFKKKWSGLCLRPRHPCRMKHLWYPS